MRILLKGLALIAATVAALAFSSAIASADPMPLPSNASASAPAVAVGQSSCTKNGVCYAVGSYTDSHGNRDGLIETDQNGVWTVSEAPLPSNGSTFSQNVSLASISCDDGECTAVGSYLDTDSDYQGLIEDFDGTSWTPEEASLSGLSSLPTNAYVSLNSVSCTYGIYCVLAGSYIDASGIGQGLIGFDQFGAWTFTTSPVPAGGENAELTSISCANNGLVCGAVGDYDDSSGAQQAMLVSGWGTSWTGIESPLPSNAVAGNAQYAKFSSISCPATTACVAAGQYWAQTGTTQHNEAMVASGAGTSWTVNAATLPGGAVAASPSSLQGTSCGDQYSCVAVGYYIGAAGDTEGLIETNTYGGGVWTAATAPLPAGAVGGGSQDAALGAVDCPVTLWCVITGGYVAGSGHTAGLIVTGTPGGWSATGVALSKGASGGGFESAACVTMNSCVVAGDYENSAHAVVGAVAGPPPQPAALTISAVDGVAYVTMAPSTSALPITGDTVTANDLTNSARGGQKVNTWDTADVNSAFFNDLTVGDSYTFTVVATNALGDSSPVTSAVQRIPSLKNINASLAPLLHPTGGAAKIKSLRKSHGFKFIYSALEAGQVNVDWYTSIGHGKHKRRVLIGVGVANTSTGAKVPVHVTLNGAGKRLLAGASKLTLSATATFTMSTFIPISVSGTFTLH